VTAGTQNRGSIKIALSAGAPVSAGYQSGGRSRSEHGSGGGPGGKDDQQSAANVEKPVLLLRPGLGQGPSQGGVSTVPLKGRWRDLAGEGLAGPVVLLLLVTVEVAECTAGMPVRDPAAFNGGEQEIADCRFGR